MAPAIDKITIILAIELFAIKGRNKTIPTKVRIDASKESIERNCSLNPSLSISNQVNPGPGDGTALKTKIITAVPTIVSLRCSGNSLINLNIKNKIIMTDPIKTIS